MSDKRILSLMGRIKEESAFPSPELLQNETLSLLETGLLFVLTHHMSESAALRTLKALHSAYPDWNELRVSQIQEFAALLKTKSASAKLKLGAAIREYLQEVFQTNHGFDLEFMRGDPTEAAKYVPNLVKFGTAAQHFLLWAASDGEAGVSIGLVRVLDRTGLMKRTSSVRRGQEMIAKLVPKEDLATFSVRFGSLVDFCDVKKPSCWECPVVNECPFGTKVFRDWEAQQKRLVIQRKREAEARAKAAARELARQAAEAKKAAGIAERKDAKRRRESERKARIASKKLEAMQKKRAAAKKVAAQKEAAKKAAVLARAAAKKAVQAKKTAAANKQKAAAKKEAAKKSSAKKKPAAKPKAAKKPTRTKAKKKPAPKKKPAAKKNATKKPGARKPAAKKKPVAKKKAAKKKTGKKRR